MDANTWQKIEEILDQTWDLDDQKRLEYVNKFVKDEDLKREILILINAEKSAPQYLDTGLETLLKNDPQIHEMADSLANQTFSIDRYQIEKEIGRGGMSVVYLARRTDGEFERDVAVKIMQPFGVDREDRFRRLRDERQILANLNHPNIAKVFDGGITPEGWPYMVMELVEGMPMNLYCSENNLNLEQRLDLFLTICEAVAYAHRNLIVHRDLKPGNILIKDNGQPKLLDFGIAKLLNDDSSNPAITRTGLSLLTPAYAAPEQFRSKPITTSTDIYSLGILFYEILCGSLPFDLSDKSLMEAERLVCENVPERPSEKASIFSDKIRGDLDVICLKALRKEPEQRYGSVQELMEDIRRYGKGIPISARPATRIYRIQKFVSRHQIGVSIATVVCLIIAALFAALLHQQNITLQERDRALTQTKKAEQVTDFLVELFNSNDPDIARGEIPTARDLLAAGALRVGSAFEENLVMRSEMLVLLGNLNQRIGEYDTAQNLLREGLDLANTIGDPEIQAKAMHTIALTDKKAGNIDKALEILREAEFHLTSEGLSPGKLHSAVLRDLTFTLSEMGHLAESADLAGAALARARKKRDLEPEALYRYLDSMGRALVAKQEHGNAEFYFTEALSLNLTLEEAPSWSMNMHNNLAGIRAYYGDHVSAAEHRKAAMELADKIYTDIPGDTQRAVIRNNLSINLINTGQLDKAIELLHEALEINNTADPNSINNRVASVHNNLGLAYRHAEEWERAMQHYSRSREINIELFGEDDIRYGIISANMARPLSRLGRFAEAEALAETALDQYLKILGPTHTMIATIMRLFADIRLDEIRPEEALSYTDKALAIYEKLAHTDANSIISTLEIRAKALALMGNLDEARQVFEEAIIMGENSAYSAGLAWPHLLSSYTEFLYNSNDQDAERYAAMALSAYMDIFGPTHPGTVRMKATASDIIVSQ